jgi:response regulator NasT
MTAEAAIDNDTNNSKTVLLAEDNATTRRCIKAHLELIGYNVVDTVSNGELAVEMARQLKPSLVILDFKMPKLNGIEAAKLINAENPTPIILITGHSDDKLTSEAIEAGITTYLVKPVTKKQLIPSLKLAYARFDQCKALKDEVATLSEAMETRKLIEKAKGILMQRCSIGEAEAFKLLQSHSQKENKKMKEIAHMVIDASKLI